MTSGGNTVWTKRRGKRTFSSILATRTLHKEWLASTLDTLDVKLQGPLLATMMDLRDAAKLNNKKNLPIGSLRLMLQATLDGVFAVDKDLGCEPGRTDPAITLFRGEDDSAVASAICAQLSSWQRDVLEKWAQKEGLGELATRIANAIRPENIILVQSRQKLVDGTKARPNFPMIVRQICDRLAGEVLFPRMGPCEIILPRSKNYNSMELMSPPSRPQPGGTAFSMVATVSVNTVPYSDELYFTVSASKRVWAEAMPNGGNTGGRATAYVIAPDHPVVPVTVIRRRVDGETTWDFDDDYAALCIESRNALPANLNKALKEVVHKPGAWWVGLPQLTRLYRRVAPHTVFEADLVDLLDEAESRLAGIIGSKVSFVAHKLELNQKSSVTMLKMTDFGNDLGVAGSAIADGDDESSEDTVGDEDDEPDIGDRETRIVKFRTQCVDVLDKVHGGKKPNLWIIGGSEREQRFIKQAANLLFGDAVGVSLDPLPKDVHGLRRDLPNSEAKSRERFATRVEAWKESGLPQAISNYDGPRLVLICAAKKHGFYDEDTVNRRAAIHSICSVAGANVHHLLPIEESSSDARAVKNAQAFIHRAQSAMMDVALAHTGYIIGSGDFIGRQLGDGRPRAVYGIQALRKNSQEYSGETPVVMAVYSRLVLETNITEIRFGYKASSRTQLSPWMKLSDGLIWLGSQRTIQGDEDWLEREFQPMTSAVLNEINAEDPRAVVLLDWQSLGRLWKELNDANLTGSGRIKLGNADLGNAFPAMSFARLRRGLAAPMGLFARHEAFYDGRLEGTSRIATGEVDKDSYFTTKKQLVELNPDSNDDRRHRAHFVGVMGYRNTVQLKRGQSCYRISERMTKQSQNEGVYSKVPLQPAAMDAALPSSIDITVMHTPDGTPPAAVATLTMGLRLGYAHYNDWTGLPAPLFFSRKIDDYIIKYPASEETDDIADSDTGQESDALAENPDDNTSILQIVAAEIIEKDEQAQAALDLTMTGEAPDLVDAMSVAPPLGDIPGHEEVSSPAAPDEAGVVADAGAANEDQPVQETVDESEADWLSDLADPEANILDVAKKIDMDPLMLYPPVELKRRRLFNAMVRGDISIRVDPPYFMKQRGLFGPFDPGMKKRINKHWKQLVEFGHVPHGKQRPPVESYLDRMADLLIHPQAAYVIDSVILFGRQIIFPVVDQAIARYNATADERVTERQRDGRAFMDLSPVVAQVMSAGDDTTLAWMIVAAAQTPNFGFAETIIQNINKILGNKTRAALHYYVNCAIACRQAILQIDDVPKRTFKPIHVHNEFDFDIKDDDVMPTTLSDTEIKGEIPELKATLRTAIDSLVPGRQDFRAVFAHASLLLDALDKIDAMINEETETREAAKAVFQAVKTAAMELIERIRELGENDIGPVRFVDPNIDDIETVQAANKEIEAIGETVDVAVKAKNELDKFYETPLAPKASTLERAKHNQQCSTLLEAVISGLDNIRDTISAARYFELEDSPETTPDGPDDSGKPDVKNDVAAEPVVAPPPENIPAESVYAMPLAVPEMEAVDPEPLPSEDAADVEVVVAQPEPDPVAEVVADNPGQDVMTITLRKPVAEPVVSQEKPRLETARPQEVSVVCRPDDETTDASDNNDVQQVFKRIDHMMDHRLYAMSSIYVDAVRETFSHDEHVHSHGVILSALCDTLDSVDCRFAVDTRLDHDLRVQLNTPVSEVDGYSNRVGTAIGVLGASLVSMLFSTPATGTSDVRWSVIEWIRDPLTGMKSLSDLVSHLADMDSKCIMLTREKLAFSKVGDKIAQEAETRRSMERARNWQTDTSIHAGWAHSAYQRMHEHIYGIGHPIGQCLAIIAKGELKHLREAYKKAKRKFDKPTATVNEAFKACGERNKTDGRYSVNATENIAITEEFIKECLDRHENAKCEHGPLSKNETVFLDRLAKLLTDSIAEIENLPCEHVIDRVYKKSAITVFKSTLRLFYEEPPVYCAPEIEQRLLIQLPMDRTYTPSMRAIEDTGTEAVCSAEDVLHVINELIEEDIDPLAQPLSEKDMHGLLNDAIRFHIEERRFLPAYAIVAILGPSVRIDPPLNQQYQKAKADLNRELQNARQRVTHAMALSALNQREANDLLRIIEVLNTSNSAEHAIGHPEGNSSAYPDFPHALAALRVQVADVLTARLDEARNKLLIELQAYVDEHGPDSERDAKRVRDMLNSSNPANLRTAYDQCAILRSGGRLPAYSMSQGDIAPKEYETFLASLSGSIHNHHGMIDALQERLTKESDDTEVEDIKRLSPEERKEAADFIQLWKDLCVERNHSTVADLAGKFFTSMGITAPGLMPENVRSSRPYTRLGFSEKSFSILTVNDCFVPPALGSPTNNVACFVVSGSHPDSEVSSLVQDSAGIPTFLLSRAKLTLSKRARLSGQSPVVLVDDNLITYMALHPEDKARRMMEIGTLTFRTQPYSADGTSVPKEMFFGRRRELDSLRNIKSLAVLYGGRRLGKSSLLAQIEREMNNDARTVAVYIPMNRDYHGGNHVTFAWRTLAKALASRRIINPMPSGTDTWQDIRNWVERELTAPTQKTENCLLLIDEADDLMARELDLKPDDVGVIGSLHQMVESLQSRIKIRYVIAGLHNLTRMTTESNSALGKAEVIALEPFNTGDDILRGIQLVTKPMAGLGFYFGAGQEDLPYRILAVCHYYPAFIQVYCKKLLEHMYNKRLKDQAITYIESSDLDAVENDHDLLTELQTKFSWTLDLDKRYKAIALILADVHYAEIEVGKNEGLTVGDIRDFCQIEAEAHFRGMSYGAYESLVDEMRRLNVLEKNGSRYRLRNPSIATLIGDRTRIKHQLEALASEPPEKHRNQGDRRISMEQNGVHSLFPMPIAWTTASMDKIDGDLIILAGNNQSGLAELCHSPLNWNLTQNSYFRAISMTPSSTKTTLAKYAPKAGAGPNSDSCLLAVTPTAWKSGDITTYAGFAQKAAANRNRLALIALPERLWDISQALKNGTLRPSNCKQPWQVVPVPPWSVDAVRFQINENTEVSDNTQACEAIVRASCGFTSPIMSLCNNRLTRDSAMKAPELMKHEGFARDLPTFYASIGWPAVIDGDLRYRLEKTLVLIHNEKRGGKVVADTMVDHEIADEDLLFMYWMGLLQEGEDGNWIVPELYLNLIAESVDQND